MTMTCRVRRMALVAMLGASAAGTALAADKVLFEDAHVRFVEVTRRASDPPPKAARLPSILAVHGAAPKPAAASTAGAKAPTAGNAGLPPQGRTVPWCQARSAGFIDANPGAGEPDQHYYRMDYKRIDGEQLADKWQEWYAWAMKNVAKAEDLGITRRPGTPYSAEWPYPIIYDALTAAPANHYLRYEDADIQLVEVMIRPGERENIHGHPYSSVYFDDGGGFYPAIETTNYYPFPNSPLPRGEVGKAPAGSIYPQCYAAIPQAPHAITVTGKLPQHFFRLQYKR